VVQLSEILTQARRFAAAEQVLLERLAWAGEAR